MFTIDNDTDTMAIVRKDTASFEVSLTNYSLMDGDKVTFTIADHVEQEVPLKQIVVQDFIGGNATIFITSLDSDLAPGDYVYDIQVNTRDGRTDTIVGPAKFKVIGGVTY